jgi:hypothetical protein
VPADSELWQPTPLRKITASYGGEADITGLVRATAADHASGNVLSLALLMVASAGALGLADAWPLRPRRPDLESLAITIA